MSTEIERLEQWHRRHAEALSNGLGYEEAELHADYPWVRAYLSSDATCTMSQAGSDADTAHPPPTA